MAKRKRRGRPKGSKNRVYRHAKSVTIPASCPACGSTELTRQPGKAIERALRGTLPTGHSYVRVIWRRHRCECGQFVMVRDYIGVEETIQPGIDGDPGDS